jgi:hypothetical protein
MPQRRSSLENNMLLKFVDEKLNDAAKDARRHKRLYRFYWTLSTVLSLAIAVSATFNFPGSKTLAGILGIVLPAITAYIVLRSPEQLWILETSTRHRLSDLKQKIELATSRGEPDDPALEAEYFQIMKDASDTWKQIKNGK